MYGKRKDVSQVWKKDSSGKESWYNEYDDKGCWPGYYICYECNNIWQNLGKG